MFWFTESIFILFVSASSQLSRTVYAFFEVFSKFPANYVGSTTTTNSIITYAYKELVHMYRNRVTGYNSRLLMQHLYIEPKCLLNIIL